MIGIVMFETQGIDEKFEKTQQKMRELEIRNGKLDQDSTDLLSQLQVTPEQLSVFIDKKDNFSDKNWEQLQERKIEIEQKLATDLSSVRDPKKAKKALEERNVGSHWLYVR